MQVDMKLFKAVTHLADRVLIGSFGGQAMVAAWKEGAGWQHVLWNCESEPFCVEFAATNFQHRNLSKNVKLTYRKGDDFVVMWDEYGETVEPIIPREVRDLVEIEGHYLGGTVRGRVTVSLGTLKQLVQTMETFDHTHVTLAMLHNGKVCYEVGEIKAVADAFYI